MVYISCQQDEAMKWADGICSALQKESRGRIRLLSIDWEVNVREGGNV